MIFYFVITQVRFYSFFAIILVAELILYLVFKINAFDSRSKTHPVSTVPKEPMVDRFVVLKNEKELRRVKAFRRGIKIDDQYGILRNESIVRFEVCKTFEFSPADWTLYELAPYDEKLESQTCRKLYHYIFEAIDLPYQNSLRRHKRVKWIVRPNGTVTNLGCTQHTRLCEPGSFFDKQRNIRIDTPPCCRKHLMQILDKVSTELNRNNISYTVAGGYVISYARRKEILHYDEDVDLFIEDKYWQSASFTKFFNGLSRKYGFYQDWRKSDHGAMALLYSETNRNGIGMWRYYRDNKNPDMIVVVNYETPQYNYQIIEPPRLVSMNGLHTKMPNNVYGYLDKTFGKVNGNMNFYAKRNIRESVLADNYYSSSSNFIIYVRVLGMQKTKIQIFKIFKCHILFSSICAVILIHKV